MPSHEEHCQDSVRKYGKRFDDLHRWMDEPYEILGKRHRMYRHDPRTTPQEAKKLFGEYGDHACLDHIRLDYPRLMHGKELNLGMDTDFCAYWMGDARAKWCRYCVDERMREGPCFELWNIVKRLAAQHLVFTNNRRGKAFGHRYRIEAASDKICYLQMLQGKMSRFPLPIEDFLYVTRTGRGGMNETPSKTRQNPFVDLILEIIETDSSIPNGARVVDAVKNQISRKDEVSPSVVFDESLLIGPAEGHYPWEVPLKRNEKASLEKQSELSHQPKRHEYAGVCPKCGARLVWRRAQRTGELYRGCTNYKGGCRYQERSY